MLASALALAIEGVYRTDAKGDKFAFQSNLGNFATQPWPQTCLVQLGAPVFANLSTFNPASMTLRATSCGFQGYLPDQKEWNKNADYFQKTQW